MVTNPLLTSNVRPCFTAQTQSPMDAIAMQKSGIKTRIHIILCGSLPSLSQARSSNMSSSSWRPVATIIALYCVYESPSTLKSYTQTHSRSRSSSSGSGSGSGSSSSSRHNLSSYNIVLLNLSRLYFPQWWGVMKLDLPMKFTLWTVNTQLQLCDKSILIIHNF